LLNDDAALLSTADRWLSWASAESRRARGLYDGVDLTPQVFGRDAMYFGAGGIHAARALISNAVGDFWAINDAVRALSPARPTGLSITDFYLGTPGVLTGLASVLEAIPHDPEVNRRPLLRAGRRAAARVRGWLTRQPPIADSRDLANLGMAHGWAGMLFSLLRWREASGARLPTLMRARLDELAALGEPSGRGLRWPWRDAHVEGASYNYMPGFCNGSAGFVHLFVTAARLLDDSRYVEIAEGAAWDAWEGDDSGHYDLCCGTAGRAYALLALHRHTGEGVWLDRARQLADMAIDGVREDDQPTLALYKGALGPALLYSELEHPDVARMPLFESEGWPTHSSMENR
jgi:hypothetical protein